MFSRSLLRTEGEREEVKKLMSNISKNGNARNAAVKAPVATADPMAYNVEEIASLERKALHERSLAERISDRITGVIGSMSFVFFHVFLFISWGLINLNFIPGIKAFDPFPFGILTLIVSAEGVFITIFILIGQNRMSRQSDRRAHLDLQVSILAEQEMTMMLRMQKQLCDHFGIDTEIVQAEREHLMEETDVQNLVGQLEAQLPSN
jgi:uncharacterized membrane protein